MKDIIAICLIAALAAACRPCREVTAERVTAARDSVTVRDSAVTRDSAASFRLLTLTDSVTVRDSTVTVVDAAGNVIGRERYVTTDRTRTRDSDERAVRKTESSATAERTADRRSSEKSDTAVTERRSVGALTWALCGFAAALAAAVYMAVKAR